MRTTPINTQQRIRRLRHAGLSHRTIAKRLGVGQGTAVKYSKRIKLTKAQHLLLKQNAYKRSLGKLSLEKRSIASRKGGFNTPSHFPIKHSREKLLTLLRNFYKKNGRIPTKRDFVSLYRPILRVFGSWNKAVKTAGFEPNPVMFAKKYIANDGHKCDSLSEKIIDDWLYARKIKHKINVPYPGNKFLTADFVVENNWIEFFGLDGELTTYDQLKKKKIKTATRFNLHLITIYPQDLFPKCKLGKILANLNSDN